MGGYDSNVNDCDGCSGSEKGTHRRHFWRIGEKCLPGYETAKAEAKAALILQAYTADAHRFRVEGIIRGENGDESSGIYDIKKPIIVEHTCQYCALHNALVSFDPWAFAYIFAVHGEYAKHDASDIRDGFTWSNIGYIEEIIEDLGVISEAEWNARRNAPRLQKLNMQQHSHGITYDTIECWHVTIYRFWRRWWYRVEITTGAAYDSCFAGAQPKDGALTQTDAQVKADNLIAKWRTLAETK